MCGSWTFKWLPAWANKKAIKRTLSNHINCQHGSHFSVIDLYDHWFLTYRTIKFSLKTRLNYLFGICCDLKSKKHWKGEGMVEVLVKITKESKEKPLIWLIHQNQHNVHMKNRNLCSELEHASHVYTSFLQINIDSPLLMLVLIIIKTQTAWWSSVY